MRRSSKTIELPSGAKLTVSIDADLFDLDPADRELVFDIVAETRRFIDATEAKVREHVSPQVHPPLYCEVCDTAEHCHFPGGSRYPPDHEFIPRDELSTDAGRDR